MSEHKSNLSCTIKCAALQYRYRVNPIAQLAKEEVPLLQYRQIDARGRTEGLSGFCRLRPDELDLTAGRFSRFGPGDYPYQVFGRDKESENDVSGYLTLYFVEECIGWISTNGVSWWNFSYHPSNKDIEQLRFNFSDPDDAFHFKLRYG